MWELEEANREAERCRLAWLVLREAHPTAIDPFAAQAYSIASNEAEMARTRYRDILSEEEASHLRNVEDAL
jgi:hypothetical protein